MHDTNRKPGSKEILMKKLKKNIPNQQERYVPIRIRVNGDPGEEIVTWMIIRKNPQKHGTHSASDRARRNRHMLS